MHFTRRFSACILTRRKTGPSGEHRRLTAETIERAAMREDDPAVRFTTVCGRLWTVRLMERTKASGEGTETVLRFSSENTEIDLADFPEDWRDARVAEGHGRRGKAPLPRRQRHTVTRARMDGWRAASRVLERRRIDVSIVRADAAHEAAGFTAGTTPVIVATARPLTLRSIVAHMVTLLQGAVSSRRRAAPSHAHARAAFVVYRR